jgi:hypothetical protein
VSDATLVPAPLYGLRTWRVAGERGDERLMGPHQRGIWPPGGTWLEASCAQASGHRPPNHGCDCGLHAWHPSMRSARRVLAGRREVPGIAETQGAIELHAEGLRAERARPYALFLVRGRNARLVRRLAQAYDTEIVEVDGPGDLLAFCQTRGLGLDEASVDRLMGPATAARYRREKRRTVRRDLLRLGAARAVVALLVVAGLRFATDPPGDRVIHGRTGEIHIHSR